MKPSSSELLSLPLDSEHRQETAEAGKEKAGDSVPVCVWFEPRSAVLNFVGFFAPFGTKNSFCNRLIFSPMFRHFFVYDVTLAGSALTVADVDSAVNNCALICALLLGVPTGIMASMGSTPDAWVNLMQNDLFGVGGGGMQCLPIATNTTNTTDVAYSPQCTDLFKARARFMFAWIVVSFYSALFILITAVLYYMCRPSECYKTTPMDELLAQCTKEVRKKIRMERHESSEESQKSSPETPFSSCNEEMEVFLKAKFMAKHKGEGEKNKEFYKWYRRKMFGSFFIIILFHGIRLNFAA